MPRQCRQLFVTILVYCQPSNPLILWDNYKAYLAEDYLLIHSEEQSTQYALSDINNRLSQFGFNCRDYNLPQPDLTLIVTPEEINLERERAKAEEHLAILNGNQRAVVNHIMQLIDNSITSKAQVVFLDGPAGTGKTTVYNTLISLLLSRQKKIAACAWTGIASILLRFGVTVHNLFKLPVPVLDTSSCNVSPLSEHAKYLRELHIIFVDEASMIPNHGLNAIDRLLRDIMGRDIPFGGKILLFGGDFRQVLPVVPHGTPTTIIEQSIKRSPLWHHFTIFKLIENMRASEDERQFAEWLLKLGNGDLKSASVNDCDGTIDIPEQCFRNESILDVIFPNFEVDRTHSIILTPKNDVSLKLNNEILTRLIGDEYILNSEDTVICENEEEKINYPIEFLNSITPTGMPPHKLILKLGASVMLLRNVDSQNGLCNGVRLKIVQIQRTILECEIITGSHIGERVFLPRLKLAPSDTKLPFVLQRIQFPIRLAYVMTINKAQGQTFNHVGIYLPDPVFSHGQLCVAFSRAKKIDSICVDLGRRKEKKTINVVYKNVLT